MLDREAGQLGDVGEGDRGARLRLVAVEERGDFDFEDPLSPSSPHSTRSVTTGSPQLEGLVERPAQLQRPVGDLEVLQRPADVGGAEREQFAGPVVGVDEEALAVDDEARDRADQRRRLAQVGVAGADVVAEVDLADRARPFGHVAAGDAAEHPPARSTGAK